MGLKFKVAWRAQPPADGKFINKEIPREALQEVWAFVLRLATHGNRWDVLELFKDFFCPAAGLPSGGSSSESWAETDLDRCMTEAVTNAPAFLDALYSACMKLAESDEDYEEDYAKIINDLCERHNIGYVIAPPNLWLREEQETTPAEPGVIKPTGPPEKAVPKPFAEKPATPAPLKVEPTTMANAEQYDVALSFASEDRTYAEALAKILTEHGVKVFYDRYEQATLWGKNLQEHLDQVYRKNSRYVVMLVSERYAQKVWTTHERRSAMAKALEATSEYILPIRIDDTDIPGLLKTIAYLDLRKLSIEEVAAILLEKLGLK